LESQSASFENKQKDVLLLKPMNGVQRNTQHACIFFLVSLSDCTCQAPLVRCAMGKATEATECGLPGAGAVVVWGCFLVWLRNHQNGVIAREEFREYFESKSCEKLISFVGTRLWLKT
jgi:hypothetical protein